MSNKITIVGGSGFVGTNLCRQLKFNKTEFEIIDIKISNRFPEYSKIADITDLDSLRRNISGDIVVHLAAVHSDNADKQAYIETNINGTQNIIKVCTEKNISRIIFASSVAVYGFADPGIDETGKISPFNEYGRTKYVAEELLRTWYSQSDNTLVIVRPTVIFGEGNRGNVYNLIKQISVGRFIMVGAGKNKKSLAYVKNVAAFLEYCIYSDVKYQLYNYVDTPDLTMNEFVKLIRNELHGVNKIGIRLPFFIGLILGYIADVISKLSGADLSISSIRIKKFCASSEFKSAKNELQGYEQPYTLAEGISTTLISDFIAPDAGKEIFLSE